MLVLSIFKSYCEQKYYKHLNFTLQIAQFPITITKIDGNSFTHALWP